MNYSHFGKLSKPGKLTLQEEEIVNGSFPHRRDLSSSPSFPRPMKPCSLALKPIPLEDMCAKQEHLIAMTKIKHFDQTQAIFQKLKYFLKPAIFIEVRNLALQSRLACAQRVRGWSRSHWVFPQKHPGLRGVVQSEQGQSQWRGRYRKQGTGFHSSDLVNVHLVSGTGVEPERLGASF